MTDDHLIQTPDGTITVPNDVLSQIVVRAAESVSGAGVHRPRRSVTVSIDGDRARVALELTVQFGLVLPEVARDVQAQITDALRTTCDVAIEAVDVTVEELK